ncbi:hypothetical protein FNV43_RR20481 [Rhamnella rubrinervis]|uniref:Uncharacterized protein n=1 Tax=Rhamnella rubrinervis TaxID=2594499 RepID=A0A8K0GX26_9ROSA|nr:hypothetical protein FNV43_RR20481 [Rhamnella rubrinervis]
MTDLLLPIKQKLHGKVAIVPSGTSGLGEVTASYFVNHGSRAVVKADVQDKRSKRSCIDRSRPLHIHSLRCNRRGPGQLTGRLHSLFVRLARHHVQQRRHRNSRKATRYRLGHVSVGQDLRRERKRHGRVC